MDKQTQVLIVGAGPAGLALAVELSKRKISYILIEKHKTRSPYSRAMGMHARTLELFTMIDPQLVNDLLDKAYRVHHILFTTEVAASMEYLDSPFTYSLIIPQIETEGVLEACLTRHGGKIWREATFLSAREVAEEGKQFIISTIQLGDGSTTEVRSEYVCGTDGNRSAVRATMGVPFEGKEYPWTALMGDVKLSRRSEFADGLHNYSTPNGLCMTIPFKDEYLRVLVTAARVTQLPPDYHLTLEDLQKAVDSIIPGQARLTEARWLTHFKASLKLAKSYRAGNFFLLGDAAHVHSPAGGQGLNTSVQDSINLGWKLSSVLHGQAPPAILDTFNSERRPVGAHVLWLSNAMLTGAMINNVIILALRNIMLRIILFFPKMHKAGSRLVSGVNISYRKQPKARFGILSRIFNYIIGWIYFLMGSPERVETGDRVPHFLLRSEDQSTWKSSFDMMAASLGFKFIIFVEGQNLAHLNKMQSGARYVESRFGIPVVVISLRHGPPNWTRTGFNAVTQCETVGPVASMGANHGDFLLIRPDGYVGGAGVFTSSNHDESHVLGSVIEKWLLPR